MSTKTPRQKKGYSMNIDDFSPSINCKTKTCGLMNGNEYSRNNEFKRFKRIAEDAASESDRIASLYNVIQANTYVCDICRNIIFPDITTSGDGRYDVMKTSAEIKGGFGNKVVCIHVCSDCVEKATLKLKIKNSFINR